MNSVNKKDKAFDEISSTFLVLIFLSIIVSIWIALQADMPGSIGHGGFFYIIYPGIIGIAILLLYLVSLFIIPKWKTVLGWTCILINLITGICFMHIEF